VTPITARHRVGPSPRRSCPHDAGRAGNPAGNQGGEDLHGGGLARAVRPEQREDLALADVQVDAVEDGPSPRTPCAGPCAETAVLVACLVSCVHATHARTLTLGQGQALVATFSRASCIRGQLGPFSPRRGGNRAALCQPSVAVRGSLYGGRALRVAVWPSAASGQTGSAHLGEQRNQAPAPVGLREPDLMPALLPLNQPGGGQSLTVNR